MITADIPLAERCVASGAYVLGTKGVPFTEANIGGTLATRDLMATLRGAGIGGRARAAAELLLRGRGLSAAREPAVGAVSGAPRLRGGGGGGDHGAGAGGAA